MQLYLDSFGAFLAVRNGMFSVRLRDGGTHAFAVRTVDAILFTKGTGMSTDAALLAVEHDIPVLLIDAQTHFPLAQLTSGRPGSIATIRKNQTVFARAPEGLAWAAAQLVEKVRRQRDVLQHWAEAPDAPTGFAADVAVADRVLAAMQRELGKPPDANPDRLRGQEGTASRVYFQQLSRLLHQAFADFAPTDDLPDPAFSGRQKRPAYDPFNTLLNYLYGMLYTSVHLAVLKAGLDPYMGILHADRYGAAPTLVFDAIEPYRPWADTVALQLALNGHITPDAFEQRDDPKEGLWLGKTGKDVVIEAMLSYLSEAAPRDGRLVKRSVQIDLEAQRLASLVRDFS
jgi:CRISPR-associated protein Cas1